MKSIGLYYHLASKQKEAERAKAVPEKVKESNVPNSSSKNTDDRNLTDIHINLWKIHRRIRKKPHLIFDFGIKIPFLFDELCLYLPFEINGNPIDLGHKLNNNRELLCTIFNDDTECQTVENKNFCLVKVKNANKFYLYNLGSENIKKEDISEGEDRGTFLNIKIQGKPTKEADYSKESIYIRFRVEVKNPSQVCKKQALSNDLLQDAFSSSNLFDIRLNEIRQLHAKVQEHMERGDFTPCQFRNIHFFYMAESKEKVENESSLKQDSRMLEEDAWNDYEPKSIIHNPIILAHHWKWRKDKEVEAKQSFNLFFSTIFPEIGIRRLLPYIGVLLLINWLCSLFELDKVQNIYHLITRNGNVDKVDLWRIDIIGGIVIFLLLLIISRNIYIWIKFMRKQ